MNKNANAQNVENLWAGRRRRRRPGERLSRRPPFASTMLAGFGTGSHGDRLTREFKGLQHAAYGSRRRWRRRQGGGKRWGALVFAPLLNDCTQGRLLIVQFRDGWLAGLRSTYGKTCGRFANVDCNVIRYVTGMEIGNYVTNWLINCVRFFMTDVVKYNVDFIIVFDNECDKLGSYCIFSRRAWTLSNLIKMWY